MVDIEPSSLNRWKGNPRFGTLIAGAILGVPAYKAAHIRDLANLRQQDGRLAPELEVLKADLIGNGMTPEEAEAFVRRAVDKVHGDPWREYDRDLAPYRELIESAGLGDNRKSAEFVFVRDDSSACAIALDEIIRQARQVGDNEGAIRLEREQNFAADLGLTNLKVIQRLPLLLVGIGFSRYFDSPSNQQLNDGQSRIAQLELRSYSELENKIPLYKVKNTTEALLYELDPWRLIAFLQVNLGTIVSIPPLKSRVEAQAFLLRLSKPLLRDGEAHLVLTKFERDQSLTVDPVAALLFGILHTISHVLKATAHRYVGIDGDALAEYLFPGHHAGLLYATSNVEFTLGGIDSVFRANLGQWLRSAKEYADLCPFDPVCANNGGACPACLYPKFGCAHFNRTLSRALLFGGTIPGIDSILEGFWAPTIGSRASELSQQSDAL